MLLWRSAQLGPTFGQPCYLAIAGRASLYSLSAVSDTCSIDRRAYISRDVAAQHHITITSPSCLDACDTPANFAWTSARLNSNLTSHDIELSSSELSYCWAKMTSSPEVCRSIKCVVVGDSDVGKTSLLSSYCRRVFPVKHVPTFFDDDNGQWHNKLYLYNTIQQYNTKHLHL